MMNLLLPTALAVIGLAAGVGIGREWEQIYPALPVPKYVQYDCWEDVRPREPWELYPDGRILVVGNWAYLVETREALNSNDKYHGAKAYGSMVAIRTFDQHTRKVPCPGRWK